MIATFSPRVTACLIVAAISGILFLVVLVKSWRDASWYNRETKREIEEDRP